MGFGPWLWPYVLISHFPCNIGSPGCITNGLHLHNTDTPCQGCKKVWLLFKIFFIIPKWRWVGELSINVRINWWKQMEFFAVFRGHPQAGVFRLVAKSFCSRLGCYSYGSWIWGIYFHILEFVSLCEIFNFLWFDDICSTRSLGYIIIRKQCQRVTATMYCVD